MSKSKPSPLDKPLEAPFPRKFLSWIKDHRIQILVFLAAFLVLFFRRPDALLNAQFWSEDAIWFSDAYNSGYSLLTLNDPYVGYLTVIQRLIALFSGFFPLELTPLVFNLCALGFQALVLVYLWSRRTNFISTEMKIFITFVYLCLPYTQEMHANVTNVQWYLSLILFLLLFMKESENIIVRWIDRFLVLVGSLSGPFSIFLLPIVIFEAWRTKKIRPHYYLVLFGALMQLGYILFTRDVYKDIEMGYNLITLLEIGGAQVFGAGLFGEQAVGFFLRESWVSPLIAIIGFLMVTYVFIRSSFVMRYFLLFGSFIFASSLISALDITGAVWWQLFKTEAFGARYFFVLHLGVFIALGWLVGSKLAIPVLLRIGAAIVLGLSFLLGVPKDFVYSPYIDFKYKAQIRAFELSPAGAQTAVPAVNPGGVWPGAVLIKRE